MSAQDQWFGFKTVLIDVKTRITDITDTENIDRFQSAKYWQQYNIMVSHPDILFVYLSTDYKQKCVESQEYFGINWIINCVEIASTFV